MENIVPREKWLYNDRCMKKWMGWLLSDHTAYIFNAEKDGQLKKVKPRMTDREISERLDSAWQEAKSVSIQINAVDNNEFVPEINGIVQGYDSGQLYLHLEDGKDRLVEVEDIRSVTFIPALNW